MSKQRISIKRSHENEPNRNSIVENVIAER